MSKNRQVDDYLCDISEAINDIADFIGSLTYEEFIADKKTINAVIRSLEILDEATKNIPISIPRYPMVSNGQNTRYSHP